MVENRRRTEIRHGIIDVTYFLRFHPIKGAFVVPTLGRRTQRLDEITYFLTECGRAVYVSEQHLGQGLIQTIGGVFSVVGDEG